MTPDFWRLLIPRISWLLRADFFVAIISGVAVAIVPSEKTLVSRYELVLATQAGIATALLGLVLAGLSLIVAFLSDALLRTLQSEGKGLAEDVWPFSFTAWLAVTSASIALISLMTVPSTDVNLLRATMGLSWGVFLWTLTSTLALIRVVYEYGVLKAASNENGR